MYFWYKYLLVQINPILCLICIYILSFSIGNKTQNKYLIFFCQRNGKTRITKPKLHFVISEWSTNNDPFQHSWFDLSKPDAAYYCCPSYTTEDINVNIWYIRVINNLLIKLLHCMTGLIHYHMTNDHTRRNFSWFRTFIIPRPYYDSSHRNYFRKSSMKEVLK
jgi:hypothetical protein